MVALIDGEPRLLNLKQILDAFIRHRREVVTRRTIFDLRKARERTHVLEGLAIALANIDPVIKMIKDAPNPATAKERLLAARWPLGLVAEMLQRSGAEASRPESLAAEFGLQENGDYRLSSVQVQAILDLRLHRLTGLEQDKILQEYNDLLAKIADLLDILRSPERLMQVIRDELEQVLEQFGDERRTQILINHSDLTVEDLISEEDVVVTLSHAGYAKAQPLSDYATQRRGGRGKSATRMKDEDFIDKLFIASTHDTMLCFSSLGKVYWKKVYELPLASRGARGRPIVNLLPLEKEERINAILAVREFSEDQFIFMATRNGVVKKTPLSHFSRPRSNGIIALDLREGDQLIGVDLTDGDKDVMLFSSGGKAIRFKEEAVRPMGRTAAGVRGIRLGDERQVISLIVVNEGEILTVTENGYGKRTPVDEYRLIGRGGQGVVSIQTSERNGAVVGAIQVLEEDEIMLISDHGTLVRTAINEVRSMGRNTQGVRLIRLSEGELLAEVERVVKEDDDESESDGTAEVASTDSSEPTE